MPPAFIVGCYEYLPNAAITFHRFHVTKVVNKSNVILEGVNSKNPTRQTKKALNVVTRYCFNFLKCLLANRFAEKCHQYADVTFDFPRPLCCQRVKIILVH